MLLRSWSETQSLIRTSETPVMYLDLLAESASETVAFSYMSTACAMACLTVVDDHLVEFCSVGIPGGVYLVHGQLRLGYAVLVYVERSADDHLLGPVLLEFRYQVPVLFGLRIGPTVEQFLGFVRPSFVDRVRPDALPEDQALDYRGWVFHLESQVVVVLGLHGRKIVPRELLLQAEYVEGGDNVLRGELRAVAPLRALAQRYLEHVGRFVSPLRSHV